MGEHLIIHQGVISLQLLDTCSYYGIVQLSESFAVKDKLLGPSLNIQRFCVEIAWSRSSGHRVKYRFLISCKAMRANLEDY
jgi:hypothetical protein